MISKVLWRVGETFCKHRQLQLRMFSAFEPISNVYDQSSSIFKNASQIVGIECKISI